MTLKLWTIWVFGALIVLITGLRYPTEGSTVTVVFASAPSAMMAIERLAALDALAIDATGKERSSVVLQASTELNDIAGRLRTAMSGFIDRIKAA